ncbi:MAG TPA: GAF domain-containing SpoIIE family protein phosphatase [Longimicrobiaceae bacterium]|nr:GAF domain-containing SpoIIE family protein phosphatase [Longimicrobiaceae bacterium]
MSSSVEAVRQAPIDLRVFRELADEYARAHAVIVRLWRPGEEGWVLEHSTGDPVAEGPGTALERVSVIGEGELHVEVTGAGSGEVAAQRSRFLASVLGRAGHHEAESHFFGRELAERYEEITLLYTISEVLGSVISLEQAAGTILGEVADTLGVRRAALWIHEPETQTLQLVASVGGGEQEKPVRVSDDASLTAAVFRNRSPMILEPGDVFPREDSYPGDSHRDSFLSVPVNYTPPRGEMRTIGVINLIGRTAQEGFSAGDQKLIAAIASQIGAAVENSRLVAESLQRERLVRELELAHDLQLKLLPSVEQFGDPGDVAARCVPADSVGGDFYHLFRLSEGRVGVMIGDVSSHGFGAALIMALTMSAVAIHASEGDPPAEVLRRVHLALIDELESTEMYLTLFYGVIDPVGRRVRFANAGHPHAFRIAATGEVQRLGTTNPPFGLVDLEKYREEEAPWSAGDLLFLFTDGLSDALGGIDGEKRLLAEVVEGRTRSLPQVLESLFAMQPAGPPTPSDDRSALLIRV